RPEQLGCEAAWHDVAGEDQIRGRRLTRLACEGREVFIRVEEGDIRVYDSRCPHQVTNIPELAVAGETLTCPRHHWKFDLRTGECIENGDRPLTRFQHRLEGGRLLVYW
ncbi:MAG: Rieske (2Fe-2S) protein, partial [Burkholderiales bacterium]